MPRLKPYTERGLKRLTCSRKGCTRKAAAQWSACADGNIQRPLCSECDIDLNRLVLQWIGDPEWVAKISAYVASLKEKA